MTITQKSKTFFTKIEKEVAKMPNCKEKKVLFYFIYRSFIKLGVLLMKMSNYKIKCEDDFDKIVIDKIAEILDKKYIKTTGQKMRQKINKTCYGFDDISKKEIAEYSKFVTKVFKETEHCFS